MGATRLSTTAIRAAANVARDTGCTVEIDSLTGNVRVLPPVAAAPTTPNPADLVDMRE